jgi:epsilon-lactone hydrolase
MPSKQSEANKHHYQGGAANAARQPSPQESIDYHDIHWTALTAEPGGVDYLEVDAGGTPAMWIVPKGCAQDRVILYSHGGGFVSGSIFTHRKLVGHLAKAAGCRALVYEYAYAHEHKYPHQLGTAFATYRWLLAQGIQPAHVALAGDSCGAILTFGILQKARDAKLPLPAAVMIMSGWLDLALTGESYQTNADKDPFFQKPVVDWLVQNVFGDDQRRDPHASPLYADLRGFPPTYFQAGAAETLVDETRMMAERAKTAGVETRIDVAPDMLHSYQMMAGRAPEADDAIRRLGDWVRPKLELPSRAA